MPIVYKYYKGTLEGGKKAAKANLERHGQNYYSELGKLGGKAKHSKPRGFAANPELAKRAGKLGGQLSKRGPSKKTKREN